MIVSSEALTNTKGVLHIVCNTLCHTPPLRVAYTTPIEAASYFNQFSQTGLSVVGQYCPILLQPPPPIDSLPD